MAQLFNALLFVATQLLWSSGLAVAAASTIDKTFGHYPHTYCRFAGSIALHPSERRFTYHSSSDADGDSSDLHSVCGDVATIWPLGQQNNNSNEDFRCDRTFDVGHVFTIYYYHSSSNYFHLHYDMLIPLYAKVYHKSSGDGGDEENRAAAAAQTHIFLPSVETRRLQEMDWNTMAFQDESKYWVQMIKMIAGDHMYQPLDWTTRDLGETICFGELNFGTPQVNFSDRSLIRGFVRHVQHVLSIAVSDNITPRVGVISRSGRRRIVNEEELMKALSTFAQTERIEFSGMSFHDQVASMQRYVVLIGMNGAGLTNGLYLPLGSVAIQLVPSGLDLNFREFGELLRGGGGGGYMEWHSRESGNRSGDTVVNVGEIVELTRKALKMFENSRQQRQTIADEL